MVRADKGGVTVRLTAAWFIAFLSAAGALAACSSGAGKSSCGSPPYTAQVDGKQRAQVASCAGNLPTSPVSISVSVGDRIEVRTSGAFSYGYPAPIAGDQRIVKLSSRTQHAARFAAISRGLTELKVDSVYCPEASPCAVFRVTVRG